MLGSMRTSRFPIFSYYEALIFVQLYVLYFYVCLSSCLLNQFYCFQLDSSALIPDLAYGGNNEAAGIVTQLAIAEALGKLKRNVSLIDY